MGIRKLVADIAYDSFLEVSINTLLRYEPIVEKLMSLKRKNPSLTVLEVGSGSKGVTRFFKHPVTGIDVEFQDHKNDLLREVKFTAEKKLPFKDNEFDAVISVDTIEHIPKGKKRDGALKEMRRVSKKHILLAYPTGWSKWDERVLKKWPKNSATYQNIKEHYDNGMPDGSEIERVFKGCRVEMKKGTHPKITYLIKSLERSLPGKIFARSVLKIALPYFRRSLGENRRVYLIEKTDAGRSKK